MLDKITTALIALVCAALMTWFVLSPFLAPQLYFRAYGGTEASTGVKGMTLATLMMLSLR